MSYTFINNCYNCKNNDKCTDYKKVQDSIQQIHSENHIGYGKIEMLCLKGGQNLSFGQAIEFMKNGYKVARKGWNDKGMFIVIMPELNLPPYNTQDTNRKVNDRTAKWIGEDKPLESQPYIAMYTAQGKWQPGWNASQSDMLSDDWVIVE
jgi:hypothetical protein